MMTMTTTLCTAMVAGCLLHGCGQKSQPILDVNQHVAPDPLGIPRSGAFPCNGETISVELFEVCDLGSTPSIDKPTEHDVDLRRESQGHAAPRDCRRALVACHRHFGSHQGLAAGVIACRGAEGALDGPFEVIAIDGSILENGFCKSGHAVGPWAVWRAGRLHEALGYGKNGPTGAVITPEAYEYRK
jgi:hypothetical protein